MFFNLRKMSTKLRKGELKERYASNENPATLGESLLSTKKERELLKQALSGTLSKEWQHQLSEKWNGFNTSGVQEDVIKATSLVISPNNNTTPVLKLRFQWDSLDHIKLSDN